MTKILPQDDESPFTLYAFKLIAALAKEKNN
jgi:hypothetical protein